MKEGPLRTFERCWLARLPALVVIALVRGYQILLSPLLGGQCRFHPSCSQYFILAVEKYGAISGSVRGLWRILRCHPFHPGGYDPP
jgi:putative membrane protein insertion efficiency factor